MYGLVQLLYGEHIELLDQLDILLGENEFFHQFFVFLQGDRGEDALDGNGQHGITGNTRQHTQNLRTAVEGVDGTEGDMFDTVALVLEREVGDGIEIFNGAEVKVAAFFETVAGGDIVIESRGAACR